MSGESKTGLKSAYDLAMERLAQKGDTLTTLSAEQKERMAEVSRTTKAKIAEIEILYAKRISEVPTGDEKSAETIGRLEGERASAIAKLRRGEDEEKQRIREKAPTP